MHIIFLFFKPFPKVYIGQIFDESELMKVSGKKNLSRDPDVTISLIRNGRIFEKLLDIRRRHSNDRVLLYMFFAILMQIYEINIPRYVVSNVGDCLKYHKSMKAYNG